MDSPRQIQTLDPASLERFQDELLEAGFYGSDGGRVWIGPLAQPLRRFTDAETMRIEIVDGWPYRQPELIVEGLPSLAHVNDGNVVCLWQRGQATRQWMTFAGWRERIEKWCSRQVAGFTRIDETMDAHAYFAGVVNALARMDLGVLPQTISDGARGRLYGRWGHNRSTLDLNTDKAGGRQLKGDWFFRQSINAPPRNLDEVRGILTVEQRARLDQMVELAKADKPRIALVAWDTAQARNALALYIDRDPESVVRRPVRGRGGAAPAPRARVRPLEFAPSDIAVLRLRAGPDAKRLAGYHAVVFGAGAIGSHTALLLAACGVGTLTIVDGERLRPGNVVRHIAGSRLVGLPKPAAVASVIEQIAPWTEVKERSEAIWAPDRLRDLVDDHDLALDATGSAGFADQLGVIGLQTATTIVTATLYRQGHVARICRQGPGDTPLHARDDQMRYPIIPRAKEPEPIVLEQGCSASVNEAPPHIVTACAGLTTEVIIDALPPPSALPDEITEIYRPLEVSPFDRTGRVTSAS